MVRNDQEVPRCDFLCRDHLVALRLKCRHRANFQRRWESWHRGHSLVYEALALLQSDLCLVLLSLHLLAGHLRLVLHLA